MLAVSRLWGRVGPNYPYYTINGTLSNKDIDAKGEFYLNTDEKLIRMDINMTRGNNVEDKYICKSTHL